MNCFLAETCLWGTGSEWFWTFSQCVILAISISLIYRQLKVQGASHVVQSLSALHARWNSESMIRARLQVCSRWIKKKRKFDGVAEHIAEFMEELGIYFRIHAIPDREMWESQSWYIEHYYWMFKSGIEEVRQKNKDRNLYNQFEDLFKAMAKISEKLDSPSFKRDENEILKFAQGEVALGNAFLELRPSADGKISKQEGAGN